jgi:hypothetical protein
MATQTGTMSPFYSDEYPEPSHLLRKVILLFLLVTALALGLAILYSENSSYPIWLKEIFAALSMTVTAGFGSRFIIRNQSGFVRFVAALAAYIVGLYMLGFASAWKYGMGPIEFWAKEMDWDGIVQLAIGVFLLMLVFRSWRHTQPLVSESTASSRRSAGLFSVRRKNKGQWTNVKSNSRAIQPPKISIPGFSWPKFDESNRKKIKTSHSIARNNARDNRGRDLPLVVNKPIRSKRRGVFRSKPHVKLALVEEHRCPYCLDIVNRTDKRGTVECEVCHTLHHKDCWEITGMCQVPHLNT